MTLIIKELIIRGEVLRDKSNEVSEDLSHNFEDVIDGETLVGYLERMQDKITKNCIETVLSKLESKK